MFRETGEAIMLVVLMLILTAGLALPAEAQNLLRNGSFEGSVAGKVPESWAYADFIGGEHAGGEVVGGAAVGRQCLKLQAPAFPADFAAYCRPIDVRELQGRELIFSCFFRTVEHPQAEVMFAIYDTDFTEREFRTQVLRSESHVLGETKDWTRFATHLTVPAGARDLVVLLRVLGGGEAWFDGVAVRVLGGEVEVAVEDTGTVAQLPRERLVCCRVRNVTSRSVPVRLEVQATEEKGRPRRANLECRLEAGEARTLETRYQVDFRTPHRLELAVLGTEPDEVFEAWTGPVPGLVDADIVEPAFRATVLASIPTDEIVVEGRLNATEEIARQTRISARLVGTGAQTSDLEEMSDRGPAGPWRLRLPAEGMLSETYSVDITAAVGRSEQVLSLPLRRARQADAEVGYDARHRLWVHGRPVFPIGLQRVPDESDLPEVAAAGVNFVITPSRSVSYRYAGAVRDHGLLVAISSPGLDGLFWQNMIEKFIAHPGLLGWYGIPLPDTQAVSPNVLFEAYMHSTRGPFGAIAQMDSHHPVLMALRPNSTMAQFAPAADIILAWSEPVPRWPLTAVADAVATGREAVNDRKPVWAVIQAAGYGWSEELEGPLPADSRPPTPAEHRAMVYLALMAGADGIVHHAWSLPARGSESAYRLRRDAPELWEGIARVNRELTRLAPMLMAGHPEPITLPFDSPLRLAAWDYEGSRYVCAVNTQDTTAAVAFDIGATPGQEIEVLFEERALIAAAGTGQVGDLFEPYAVHIYRLGE